MYLGYDAALAPTWNNTNFGTCNAMRMVYYKSVAANGPVWTGNNGIKSLIYNGNAIATL